MKGSDSKQIASVETDLRIIKKNLDRLNKRLRSENEKSLIPEIAFTLSTASKILNDSWLNSSFDLSSSICGSGSLFHDLLTLSILLFGMKNIYIFVESVFSSHLLLPLFFGFISLLYILLNTPVLLSGCLNDQ